MTSVFLSAMFWYTSLIFYVHCNVSANNIHVIFSKCYSTQIETFKCSSNVFPNLLQCLQEGCYQYKHSFWIPIDNIVCLLLVCGNMAVFRFAFLTKLVLFSCNYLPYEKQKHIGVFFFLKGSPLTNQKGIKKSFNIYVLSISTQIKQRLFARSHNSFFKKCFQPA